MGKNDKNKKAEEVEVVVEEAKVFYTYALVPPSPGSGFLQVVKIKLVNGVVEELTPVSPPEFKDIAYKKLMDKILETI